MKRELLRLAVVFDVHVLVKAVVDGDASEGESQFGSFPSPPPVTGSLSANCVGIISDAAEWMLMLSPHILENVRRVLAGQYGWEAEPLERYLRVLIRMAKDGGGQVLSPVELVADCPDYEDNRILELALVSGAPIIVSDDEHLRAMSPWRGIPIITMREFVTRTDVMRRSAGGR